MSQPQVRQMLHYGRARLLGLCSATTAGSALSTQQACPAMPPSLSGKLHLLDVGHDPYPKHSAWKTRAMGLVFGLPKLNAHPVCELCEEFEMTKRTRLKDKAAFETNFTTL